MKITQIIQFLKSELKHELHISPSQPPLEETDRKECQLYFKIKAGNLLGDLLYGDFLNKVDHSARNETENCLGWTDTFDSWIAKMEPSLYLSIELSRFEGKLCKSTLTWFVDFLKKEYHTPAELTFPDFKPSTLYELGFVLAIYYQVLARALPLHLILKADILSHEVSKRLHQECSRLTYQGKREIGRVKQAKIAKAKTKSLTKQSVLDVYHRTDAITATTRPYTTARLIHEKLKDKTQQVTSIKTILRYLREEKLVK